jgi:hypothetical protein
MTAEATRPLTGAQRITAERARQEVEEGYGRDHDRGHGEELERAAAAYVTPVRERKLDFRGVPLLWPWHRSFWKPTPEDRIRELEKAGALIAAAIDDHLAARAD